MNWLRRVTLIWMVATTVHAPFPVFDGDNLRSGEDQARQSARANWLLDIDFVLLGCDPPDDSDDGPVDDDPESGSGLAFGLFFAVHRAASQFFRTDGLQLSEMTVDFVALSDSASQANTDGLLQPVCFSFGKLCVSGLAHLRC